MSFAQKPGTGPITDNSHHHSFLSNARTGKRTPLSLLTLVISGLASTAALADSGSELQGEQTAWQTTRNASKPFFEGSSIDLKLRNFYIDKDYKNKTYTGSKSTDCVEKTAAGDTPIQCPKDKEAWAQGFMLNMDSGYFGDLIGATISLYGVAKLVGKEDKYGSGALKEKKPKIKGNKWEAKQESYGKIGQAYLKAKFGNEDINGNIKAGAMMFDTPLLNESDSRTTPSSHEGIYADVNYDDVTAYGVFSNRYSTKTNNKYLKYKNKLGDGFNVGIMGAKYDADNGLTLEASAGKARNYMTQYYANAAYTLKLAEETSVLLDSYYYQGKDDDEKKYGSRYKSKLWNLVTELSVSHLSAALSYQAVIGDEYNYSWSGEGITGLQTWNSVMHFDFNRQNEKSWMGKVSYSFDGLGLPGLSVSALYVNGEFRDSGKNHKEWERDTQVRYAFQEAALKGLAVTWRNGTARTAKSYNPGYGAAIDENRIIIDYTLPLI
ncbi:OprD family outer membrane porin [Parendozoicomonas haliclonae]|uniref:Porin D n=1 Tax=Parendozoicomonas haliclonae TaxID=1960125 RepID=A0A1X7AF56_9GAMM|nr:OprD family outer membrane porin [Parendozoicomonas haliclonae]SMA36403.1 Porin D precursor [Parendozoicomonas haliclonae]